MKEWLIKQIDEAEKVERTKPWVQEEIELLSNEDYQKAYTYLAKKRGFKGESIADYEIEPEALSPIDCSPEVEAVAKTNQGVSFHRHEGNIQAAFCRSSADQTVDGGGNTREVGGYLPIDGKNA